MTTTATRMNTKLRACAGQRLSCQHIVLTNGPSLTLKTTLARYLGYQLRIPVVHVSSDTMSGQVLEAPSVPTRARRAPQRTPADATGPPRGRVRNQ